jgi:ribosomal protein L12E/L44/L45/RPP1/RPP2
LGIPSSAKARRAAEHASPLACAQEGEEEEEEEKEEEGEEDKRKKRPLSSS